MLKDEGPLPSHCGPLRRALPDGRVGTWKRSSILLHSVRRKTMQRIEMIARASRALAALRVNDFAFKLAKPSTGPGSAEGGERPF